jgi:predicted kinase
MCSSVRAVSCFVARGLHAVAIVFDLPPAIVLERNRRRRARLVDETIVAEHQRALRRLVDAGAVETEGFSAVYRVRQPRALEALVVERRATNDG